MVQTKRPRIDLPDDLEQQVQNYANEHGVKMPRAYRELIENGLEKVEQ